MMKNRLSAAITAAACILSCMTGFPAAAETTAETTDALSGGTYFYVADAYDPLVLDIAYYYGLGTLGCGANLDVRLEGQKSIENGDILWVSAIGDIAEIYPCCIHLTEDAVVKNLGSAEELGEIKPLIITKTNGYTYFLQDESGETYYFLDELNSYLEDPFMDDFQAGDTVDFLLYNDMVVKPLGESETALFPPVEYVVVDRYETQDSWGYIVMEMDGKGSTFTLSEDTLEACLREGEDFPQYGDILGLQGYRMCSEKVGTNGLHLNFYNYRTGECDGPGVITNLGSVIEQNETEIFTAGENFSAYRSLEDRDGNANWITIDYLDEGDVLYNAEIGAQVEMYTYQGYPTIPVEQECLPVEEYAVVGAKNDDYVLLHLRDNAIYTFSGEDAALCLTEGQNAPVYGDILKISGYPSIVEADATDAISYYSDRALTQPGGTVEVLETVISDESVIPFTFHSLEGWDTVELYCNTTRSTYQYWIAHTTEYPQIQAPSWDILPFGTSVEMYTYEGKPIIPVPIPLPPQFAVIGEKGKSRILMNLETGLSYYLSGSTIYKYLEEGQEWPVCGDIVTISGTHSTSGDGRTLNYHPHSQYDIAPIVSVNGTLSDVGVTTTFTKTGEDELGRPLLADESGTLHVYETDFLAEGYTSAAEVDWTKLDSGDAVTMIVSNGYPILPVSVSPLGDANDDGALDVLDIITLNKYILGGGALPLNAKSSRADFNGDGVIDGTDALCAMKRIVGLEE